MRKAGKVLLAAGLALVLLILAAAGAAYGYYHSKVAKLQADVYIPETVDPTEGARMEADIQALDEEMRQKTQQLEQMEAVEATGEVQTAREVINILLIGTDEYGGDFGSNARGDSCMLLSINTYGDAPVISLVSFERGMGVPILEGEYEGQWDWLTHTFRYGGAELMTREIRECFKLDVEYYVRVNFETFIAGIDALGGVDVYLDEAEVFYFVNGFQYPQAVVGMNHLQGQMALKYARLREIDSDWVRIQRQREVVQSAINQVKTMSLTQINDLVDTMLPMIRTNLTEEVITKLMLLALELPGASIQQMTIPQQGTYGGMTGMGGRGLFAVDFEENARVLQEFLYPQNQH